MKRKILFVELFLSVGIIFYAGCESVLEKDRQAAEDHFRKGIAFKQRYDFQPALAQFDSALVKNPAHFMALLHEGLIYAELKNYKKSDSCYQRAVQIKPEFLDAWYNLGNNALKQQRYKDAINTYQKLLQLKEAPEFWHNTGRAYLELGESEPAQQCFLRALQLDSTYAYGYASLGALADRAGRHEKAVVYYAKATRFESKSDAYWYKLGLAWFRLGQVDSAEAALQKALKINPDHIGVVLNLAKLLRARKDPQAQQLFQQAETLRQREAELSRLRRAITQHPEDPYIRYRMALQLAERKQWEEAAKEFKAALFLNPHDNRSRVNLANVYFITGGINEAIKEYEAALAANANFTEALANLGTAYSRLGNAALARKYWQDLLKIDPQNSIARQGLAGLENQAAARQ